MLQNGTSVAGNMQHLFSPATKKQTFRLPALAFELPPLYVPARRNIRFKGAQRHPSSVCVSRNTTICPACRVCHGRVFRIQQLELTTSSFTHHICLTNDSGSSSFEIIHTSPPSFSFSLCLSVSRSLFLSVLLSLSLCLSAMCARHMAPFYFLSPSIRASGRASQSQSINPHPLPLPPDHLFRSLLGLTNVHVPFCSQSLTPAVVEGVGRLLPRADAVRVLSLGRLKAGFDKKKTCPETKREGGPREGCRAGLH